MNAQYIQEGRSVIQIEKEAIHQLEKKIDANFSKACELILNTQGRLIVMGIGKSGHIGRKIAATFASTGTPAFFVHPAEAVHGDLGMITPNDTVFFISYSGSTPELTALISPIEKLGARRIAMTGSPTSPLAMTSDIHLDVSVNQEACPLGLAPTASTTAALVMGDALAIAVLKAKGFTSEQFGFIHPGGTLGRRLSVKIKDLMLTGDHIPYITEDFLFKNAILEIQDKKLGMAVIVDNLTSKKLLGILTDGDIRRSFLQLGTELNPNTKISELNFSKSPKTLGPQDEAIRAINLMETHKITSLVITEDQKNISGVLHLHHLLTSGLI